MIDYSYENLIKSIVYGGAFKQDRTGTGTFSKFGVRLEYDLRNGFPLLTTKKVNFDAIVHELIWIISGDTNIKYLTDNNIKIWNEWADSYGELGPVYGHQWRHWDVSGEGWKGHIDQLSYAIDLIKNNPESRRIVVSAWNPAQISEMALPPCHMFFQFNVEGEFLDLQMYQRSGDMFLGVPFNIASYSLLLTMVAQVTGKVARHFVWVCGDAHVYSNHVDAVMEQLSREAYHFPQVKLNPDIKNIDDFVRESVELVNYQHHPYIKAEVSV